jgi:ketosteroid isomerase-like protein
MTTLDVAQQYVELCKQGKSAECLDKLYDKDAVSVEAVSPPGGGDRIASGLDAIKAKGKSWGETNTVHKAEVTGPFPNEDRFAVRFTFDVTNKPSGQRMTMDEVGLFTVKNGKIAREEFFYTGG